MELIGLLLPQGTEKICSESHFDSVPSCDFYRFEGLNPHRPDERLRESRERLSLATESAGMVLWIIDIPKDQVWVTDGARELLSFPADEAPTMESFARTAHDNDRALVRQAMKQAMETERKIFFEYRVQHPDGRISWVSTRGNSRCNADGEVDKIMGATTDVSDRKQAEAEAQVLREELFHVTRVLTLGQLTAAITHEVNQPLAAIKSNAQAALRLLSRETPDLQVKLILLVTSDESLPFNEAGSCRAAQNPADTIRTDLEGNSAEAAN